MRYLSVLTILFSLMLSAAAEQVRVKFGSMGTEDSGIPFVVLTEPAKEGVRDEIIFGRDWDRFVRTLRKAQKMIREGSIKESVTLAKLSKLQFENHPKVPSEYLPKMVRQGHIAPQVQLLKIVLKPKNRLLIQTDGYRGKHTYVLDKATLDRTCSDMALWADMYQRGFRGTGKLAYDGDRWRKILRFGYAKKSKAPYSVSCRHDRIFASKSSMKSFEHCASGQRSIEQYVRVRFSAAQWKRFKSLYAKAFDLGEGLAPNSSKKMGVAKGKVGEIALVAWSDERGLPSVKLHFQGREKTSFLVRGKWLESKFRKGLAKTDRLSQR